MKLISNLDIKEIRKQCQKMGSSFVDPDFPPNADSLCKLDAPEIHTDKWKKHYGWLRAQDIKELNKD